LAIFAGATESRSYKRGLYISAARSYLFNRLLSARVTAGSWNRALPGEALALEGTRSFFVAETLDEDIESRLAALDVHPTGPLWGLGESPARDEALRVEQEALADLGEWRAGLEAYGARANRRALRVKLRELSWRWLDDGSLELAFGLPPGAYATSALRELLDTGAEPEDEGEAED
jgi:tRNA pseudouridine13 synthase